MTTEIPIVKCFNNSYGHNCEYRQLNSSIFMNSTILTQENSLRLLNLIKFPDDLKVKFFRYKRSYFNLFKLYLIKFTLIYQASKDGFKSSDFHRKCDNQTSTLVVIKTNLKNKTYVFGG